MTEPRRLSSFLAGRFTERAGDPIPSLNPSDPSDVVALVPSGTACDADDAAEAAAEALPAWRRLPGAARAEYLQQWSGVVDARREELAQAMAREVGKPIAEARGEAGRCVTVLRYYAGEAVREIGEVIPAQGAGSLQLALRRPLGVVALITPWNFPLAIPLWKAAPALAFGNTVVLKPAEASGACAALLAETAAAAGLPPGVFNVLQGAGDVVGSALVAHPLVAGVSFTGSAAVGARVAATAASRNIRFQTEMGGKNAAIVRADADLDLAARLVASGAFRYAGQKCTATSRVIVERPVLEPFLDRLLREARSLSLGPVTAAACAIGPLISAPAVERVSAAVAGCRGERLLGGDGVPAELARGWFVPPAVFRDVDAADPVRREELFGPVLAVLAAEDLDEAIALANETRYGLSAALFTRDLRAAMSYVERIEAGMVRVNGDTTGVDPHAPFGGVKGSSSGSREQGRAARDFYTEIRTVQLNP